MNRTRRLAVIAVLAGVLLGTINSLSSAFGSPYGPHSLSKNGVFPLEVLAALLGTNWAWGCTAMVVGLRTRRVWLGAGAGILALLVADLCYYLSDWVLGVDAQFSAPELAMFGVLAVPLGAVMGGLGAVAKQPHVAAPLAALAAPVLVAWSGGAGGSDHIQPWPERLAFGFAIGVTIGVAAEVGRRLLLRDQH